MRSMAEMGEAYRTWYFNLDAEFLQAITDKRLWFFTLLLSLTGMLAASHYEPISQFFELRYSSVLGLLGLLALCAVLVSSAYLRTQLNGMLYATLLLITSAVFQMFMWSIVVYSVFPGAAVMSAFPILLASYHGMFFQASQESPYAAIAILVAIAFSLFISRSSPVHLAIIGLVGPLSLGAAFIMGGVEKKRIQLKQERDQLRSALDAQMMLDSIKKADDASRIVRAIKGNNHDACNTLSSILMNMQMLSLEVSKTSTHSINDIFGDISQSIDQLRSIIENGRDMDDTLPEKKSVDVIKVLETCIDEFCKTYPMMDITLHRNGLYAKGLSDNLSDKIAVSLFGGKTTLYRIVMNLFINARQGNGVLAGNKIDITLKMTAAPAKLTLSFTDNGPGFSTQQLACSATYRQSTKQHGSGLGLYTVEQLVIANEGVFTRYNTNTAGAGIDIVFNQGLTR